MNFNYLFVCLLGISVYFVADTVSREAIINGNIVKGNPFPYHVSISINDSGHICGGGIISDEYIVTAASCFIGSNFKLIGSPIHVLAGTNDMAKPGVFVDVRKVIVPITFRWLGSSFIDDIAVLRLKKSLKLDRNHNLMKLALSNVYQSITNSTAVIPGFGWNWIEIHDGKRNGGYNDTQLRFAEANILSYEQCQRDHPKLKIYQRFICAKLKQYDDSKPRGVCIGDSGSPLVHKGKIAIGVLALSKFECSDKSSSGVYTRISFFRQFLDTTKNGRITKNMFALDA